MKPLSREEIEFILEEVYKHGPSFISELSDYELEKVLGLVLSKVSEMMKKECFEEMEERIPRIAVKEKYTENELDWTNEWEREYITICNHRADLFLEYNRRNKPQANKHYTIDELKDWVIASWNEVRPTVSSDNKAAPIVREMMLERFGETRGTPTIKTWVKGYVK